MPFPPTTIYKQARWYSSREGLPIQCIIAHDTERSSDNTNSIAYLQRGGEKPDGSDKKVSIHALIQPDGTTYIMVDDYYAANHAGFGDLTINGVFYSENSRYNVNQISLGFELEYTKPPNNKPYPEAQLLAMGYWIAKKREQYGNLPIYRHQTIDPTRRSDTRNLTTAQIEYWVNRAQEMLATVPTPENPVAYRMLVPQVVYTARDLESNFAGNAGDPLILQKDDVIPIGDITGAWLWIARGWGFIPIHTAQRVT